MNYTFTPLSDEELNAIDLIDEGVYDFQVIKATRRTSKSGNPMCELMLDVWDINGKAHHVYDYLVFSSVNLNIKKVSHFCKAVGLHEEYKRGDIPEGLANYCGKLQLGIQDERPNPSGGTYPKKNVVADYVPNDLAKTEKKEEKKDDQFNDDLPF